MLRKIFVIIMLFAVIRPCISQSKPNVNGADKPRIIVTSDGEIDDECSLVRFLLYANEWNIEGIITSSSQYHWHGHKWAGDDWAYYNPDCLKMQKITPFKEITQTRKQVFLNLLTTFGLKQNEHSIGLIDKAMTMDVLFTEEE